MTNIIYQVIQGAVLTPVKPLPIQMRRVYPSFQMQRKREAQISEVMRQSPLRQHRISQLQGRSLGQSHLLDARERRDTSKACFVTLDPSPVITSAMVIDTNWWLKRMPENAIKVLPQPMGNENQRRWG